MDVGFLLAYITFLDFNKAYRLYMIVSQNTSVLLIKIRQQPMLAIISRTRDIMC